VRLENVGIIFPGIVEMSKPTSVDVLAKKKEVLKEKKAIISDKKECEEEVQKSGSGYELNRALLSLENNKRHLEKAVDDLESFSKRDAQFKLQAMTLQQQKQGEIEKADAALDYAKKALEMAQTRHAATISQIELKYEARTDKKTEIVEREYEKIKARVSNFEGKVAMCQLVIDKLQNFKPKPLIRVEFQEKKLDREVEFIEEVEAMNDVQQKDRDAYFNKLVPSKPVWEKSWSREERELEEMRKGALADAKKQEREVAREQKQLDMNRELEKARKLEEFRAKEATEEKEYKPDEGSDDEPTQEEIDEAARKVRESYRKTQYSTPTNLLESRPLTKPVTNPQFPLTQMVRLSSSGKPMKSIKVALAR